MVWRTKKSRFFGGGGAAPLDPDAEAFIARWGTPPSAPTQEAINALVIELKAQNIWDKLDVLNAPTGAGDGADGGLNWVASDFPVNPIGGLAFTPGVGWVGNGTTHYIDTGYAPSTGVLFQQNNASFGVLTSGGTDSAAEVGHGISALGGTTIIPRAVNGVYRHTVNCITVVNSANGASTTRLGLTAVNRSASNATQMYRNGVSVLTGAINSQSRNSANLYVLAINDGSGAAFGAQDQNCVAYWIGASMTAGEHLAMYNALQAYAAATPP